MRVIKKLIFSTVIAATIPCLVQAKEPARFSSMDTAKKVWIIDVPGRAACPTAAQMLAKSRHMRLDRLMPMFDGDLAYSEGCLAALK